jgi:hypothetical protein
VSGQNWLNLCDYEVFWDVMVRLYTSCIRTFCLYLVKKEEDIFTWFPELFDIFQTLQTILPSDVLFYFICYIFVCYSVCLYGLIGHYQ